MKRRRKDLPRTVKGCHTLILELYETIDELRARIAHLERELYGVRRERFLNDETDERHATDLQEKNHQEQGQPHIIDDTHLSPRCDHANSDSDFGIPHGDATAAPEDASPPTVSPPAPTQKPPGKKGRGKRVYPPDTPRLKVFHPLDPNLVPPEVLNNPSARRFYRFEREEVELPQSRIRILEH